MLLYINDIKTIYDYEYKIKYHNNVCKNDIICTKCPKICKKVIGEGFSGKIYELSDDDICTDILVKINNYNSPEDIYEDLLILNSGKTIYTNNKIYMNYGAPEIVASYMISDLVHNNICCNFPLFLGSSYCDNKLYMYIQRIKNIEINDSINFINFDKHLILFQGLMCLMALNKLDIQHLDISYDNVLYQQCKPRHLIYKLNGNYYSTKSKSNLLLYLIDFGVSYKNNKIESEHRILQDISRINVNINWDITKHKDMSSHYNSNKNDIRTVTFRGCYNPIKHKDIFNSHTHPNYIIKHNDILLNLANIDKYKFEKLLEYRRKFIDLYTLITAIYIENPINYTDEYIKTRLSSIYDMYYNIPFYIYSKSVEYVTDIYNKLMMDLINHTSNIITIKSDEIIVPSDDSDNSQYDIEDLFMGDLDKNISI